MTSEKQFEFQLRKLQIGRRNRCNESHHFCKYPDAIVEKARLLRSQGLRNCEISAELGIDRRRISEWLTTPPYRRAPAIYSGIRRVIHHG